MKEKALKDFWVRMESGSSTVTGSFIYLKPNFPNGKKEPEIVFDCGTFLTDEYKGLNKDFICNPSKISYVFVTHEHIDHMGRLAGFYHQGYSGKVYASEYTVYVVYNLFASSNSIYLLLTSSASEEGQYNNSNLFATLVS